MHPRIRDRVRNNTSTRQLILAGKISNGLVELKSLSTRTIDELDLIYKETNNELILNLKDAWISLNNLLNVCNPQSNIDIIKITNLYKSICITTQITLPQVLNTEPDCKILYDIFAYNAEE